jgi:hypothetical protein
LRRLSVLLAHPLTILGAVSAIAIYLWSINQQVDQPMALVLSLQPVCIGLVLEVWWEVLTSRSRSEALWDLFRQKGSSPILFGTLERILAVWNDNRASEVPFAPLRRLLQEKFDRFTAEVEGFSSGRARFDTTEWFGIDIEMMRCAQSEVRAVSHAESSSIWETPSGRKYWQVNQERIKLHGVKCTRVFVLALPKMTAAEISSVNRVMTEQQSAGANILVADSAKLDPRLCQDMAIIDEATCSRLIWTSSGASVGIELSWNPRVVEAAIRDFEILVRNSIPLDTHLGPGQSAHSAGSTV